MVKASKVCTIVISRNNLKEQIPSYNRENETYNFLKRNVHFSLFFHHIKTKAFNHRLTGN